MLKNILFGLAAVGILTSTALAESQLRVRLLSGPQTLDWNLAHTSMETPITMNIMEGLVEFDRAMKVRPRLAEGFTVSADGRTYTFKLKKNVLWSDGVPLQADDFVFSWQRLLDPETAASYAYFLFPIEGAEDFNARKITDFSKVGVKALDKKTLQIRLRQPVSYFAQLLTFWVTFPLRRDVVTKHGKAWSKTENMVVLGPFAPVPGQPQEKILLKRNEKYHGKRPALDSVLFRVVEEDSTAFNLFQTGQLDLVTPVSPLEAKSMEGNPALRNDPYFRTCYLSINTRKAPFDAPEARQALAMAVDNSKIPRVIQLDVKPADSLIPSNIMTEARKAALPFSPEQAKARLKATGQIELVTYSRESNALLSQYIQNQIQKNLGLQVSIEMAEFKTYRNRLEQGAGNVFTRCWGADYPDPDSYLGLFLSTSGNNRTGWKNEKYDALIKKGAELADGPQRSKVYKNALDLLLRKEAVIVPLYYDTITYLLNPRVKNFAFNPLNYPYFREAIIH